MLVVHYSLRDWLIELRDQFWLQISPIEDGALLAHLVFHNGLNEVLSLDCSLNSLLCSRFTGVHGNRLLGFSCSCSGQSVGSQEVLMPPLVQVDGHLQSLSVPVVQVMGSGDASQIRLGAHVSLLEVRGGESIVHIVMLPTKLLGIGRIEVRQRQGKAVGRFYCSI